MVSHDNGLADLPEGHDHGEIPGDNADADADGFTANIVPARIKGIALSFYLFLPGKFEGSIIGEIFEHPGAKAQITWKV